MQDVNMGTMLGKGFKGFSVSFFATICESLVVFFFFQKKRFKNVYMHTYINIMILNSWNGSLTAKDETPVKRPDAFSMKWDVLGWNNYVFF